MILRRFEIRGPRLAAALTIAIGAGVAISLVHRGAIDPAAIRDAVAGNPMAPLVFVALQVAASLLFVPRTVLGIAAGLLFGFAWGAFWANLGAVAGAAAGFAFVRWIGGGEVDLDRAPGLGSLVERAERGGWRAVAIIRLIPGLPHSLVNGALALTRIGWRDYLIGSFLGMLPMTLVQVDIGAAGGEMLQGYRGWVAGCLLLATALGASFLIKRAVASRK
jgi:uncharacterized membrane protein YdjX (TVP38/TMEM64 family)